MSKGPEARLRLKAQKLLDLLPNTARFTIQQKSINGTPDNLLCIRSLFIAIEFKSDTGKLSALQRHALEKIEKAGGLAIVARPLNWKEVFFILEEYATLGRMNDNIKIRGF